MAVAAAAGNLVLSLDSGADITVNLDGTEDAAGVATKIETAVNAANPASSGQVATANSDGTVVFDFTNATGAPAASISGNILTIDPDAVGKSGDLKLSFDVGSAIVVALDGTEANVDAIAAKIVTAVNNVIPKTSGNISTANGDGTVTFDFTPSGSSVCNGIRHFGVGIITSVSDGAVTQVKVGDQAINEAKMQISNAPVNGYMLTAQSGNTGGLTWAAQPSSGGMTLISSTNLANITAASSYRISVNMTGYHIMYISLGRIATSSSGSMPDFKLGFNNDSTGSNYMFYRLNADNAENKGDLSFDNNQFFMNGSGFAGFTTAVCTANSNSVAICQRCIPGLFHYVNQSKPIIYFL